MSLSSIGSRLSPTVQSLVDMRRQLDDLQRQLGTGQRSTTYAGLGLLGGVSVGLRSQLSSIGSFGEAMTNVGVRLDLSQSALTRLVDIRQDIKSTALKATTSGEVNPGVSQQTALSELGEVLSLLNTKSGDRYLFAGRTTDTPAVETMDHILDGDGARAGLKQAIEERRQADLGANGGGRVNISRPAGSAKVRLAEGNTSFGLKIESVTSTLTGGTVNGPTGARSSVTVDFATNPAVGDTVQYRLSLPDGSTETLTLTATDTSPPGDGQFTIGATPEETADNFRTSLTVSLKKIADTSLTAASAVAAAKDFFSDPPMRVEGPPFTSATTSIAGTEANTVFWYTGETGSDPARSTAVARIDTSITVSYGVRANEDGIRSVVQNLATLAAMSFSSSDPNAAARSVALNQRVGTTLDSSGDNGQQTIEQIQSELASAQRIIKATTDRHTETKTTLSNMVQQIEGVSDEEAAVNILAMQTRLQASLQTTALMLQTSLAKLI